MSSLTNLEQLELSDTDVEDAGLRHLAKLKKLFRLDISYTG